MPVNPNIQTQTSTPTSLVTTAISCQPFDLEARMFVTGVSATSVVGILYGSVDNVNFFPIGCYRDSDGSPQSSSLNIGTFPSSYWFSAAPWDYLKFVPSAVSGTSVTVAIQTAVNLGGSPAQSAVFVQNQALLTGMSIIADTDLQSLVSP